MPDRVGPPGAVSRPESGRGERGCAAKRPPSALRLLVHGLPRTRDAQVGVKPVPTQSAASPQTRRLAHSMLHHLLDAVDRGELTADTPAERRNVRRLEGMLAALEGTTTRSRPEPEK